MTGLRLAFVLASAAMLLGCRLALPGVPNAEDLVAAKKEAEALAAKNAELQRAVELLDKRLTNMEVSQAVKSWDAIALITPGDVGYSAIKFDLGTLTVALADVEPYANGSRVSIKFGNTLAATINGLKATVDWGRMDDHGMIDAASEKTKEISFSEPIKAGSWTSVPIVLEGTPPANLGYVRVHDVAHTGIRLFGK